MKAKILSLLVIFSIVTLMTIQDVDALMPETHQVINEQVAKTPLNGFVLDSYLKNNLAIIKGIDHIYNGNTASKWISLGGSYEDIPFPHLPEIFNYVLRSPNHFHNPLTDSGFSGVWGTGFGSGISAITWMQEPLGVQSLGGNYAWSDVRNYYLSALTATTFPTRNANFADTFRGLGQLMHLVEDMSVPEHTRDDGHYHKDIDATTYEGWVAMTQSHDRAIPGSLLNDAIANPIFFDSQYLATNPSQFNSFLPIGPTPTPVPIANLFDTNTYSNPNPDPTATIGVTSNGSVRLSTIGLSEYSNANFLSPDSMWTFPYPAFNSNIQIYEAPYYATTYTGTETVNRVYLRKTGDGDPIEHLAVTDLYCNAISSPADCGYDYSKAFYFTEGDENVYKDYASHLLPRAVGYSASLIQYFFRGQLELTAPDRYVYAIADAGDGKFKKDFKVKVKNVTSTGEGMSGGQVQLVITYMDHGVNPIQYPDLTQQQLPFSTPSPSDFKYIVIPATITPGGSSTISIPSNSPIELTFDLSQVSNNISFTASDISIQVVYSGQLGNETNAVAVGYLDISEPTSYDVTNDYDLICVNGAPVQWNQQSADAAANATPALDLYAHNLSNVYIKFSSPNNHKYVFSLDYNVSYNNIIPGQYGSVYFLTDVKGYDISYRDVITSANGNDHFTHSSRGLEATYLPVTYFTDFSKENQSPLPKYYTYAPVISQLRGIPVFEGNYTDLFIDSSGQPCSLTAIESASPGLSGPIPATISP
jgi:hypothetical protein